MSNRYIVPMGILIAAVLIIAAGFVFLNPPNPHTSQHLTNENESYVEPSEKEAHSFMPEIKISADELKKNSEVPFKLGKKYEYKMATQNTYEHVECKDEVSQEEYYGQMRMYYTYRAENDSSNVTELFRAKKGATQKRCAENDSSNVTEPKLPKGCERKNETTTDSIMAVFEVEKMERYKEKECFVITLMLKQNLEEIKNRMKEYMKDASEEEIENAVKEQQKMMESMKTFLYYSKDDGKIMKMAVKAGNTETTFTDDMANFMSIIVMMGGMGAGGSGTIFFNDWMLALNENFRWIQKIDVKQGEEKHKGEVEYIVTEVEKVNNRDCFKVEVTFKDLSDQSTTDMTKAEMKNFLWIDKEKRILVKSQSKMSGLGEMNSETILTSEI